MRQRGDALKALRAARTVDTVVLAVLLRSHAALYQQAQLVSFKYGPLPWLSIRRHHCKHDKFLSLNPKPARGSSVSVCHTTPKEATRSLKIVRACLAGFRFQLVRVRTMATFIGFIGDIYRITTLSHRHPQL